MNELSRMTLGTVQLGLDYGIANKEGKPDDHKAFAILDKAVDKGVNCLDTAAGYGDSEEVIGRWLKTGTADRKELRIATKFKLGDIEADEVEYELIGSVERSLARLGTDYVDYLLMHDASEYQKFGREIDSTIAKLLKQGCVREAGASGYDYQGISNIASKDMYSAFQIPVNLLDYRIAGTDAEAKLSGKTIFVRSVYLQGLFFKDTTSLKGNLREIIPYIKKIRKIADKYDYPISRLAIGYVNSLGFVDSLVVGADNPSHVEDNADLIGKPRFAGDFMHMLKDELDGAPEWLFYPWKWDRQEV
ncbi:MAG TPA: aldo/keto reductase [Clostridia bacterium]|nr:aldo/keto reductase [Clostridia bacterium]HRX41665.1 aldo/keto reductase [Clostridia bacterium]